MKKHRESVARGEHLFDQDIIVQGMQSIIIHPEQSGVYAVIGVAL